MIPQGPVGDTVDELLGGVERLAHVLGLPEGVLGDAASDVYDVPQERLAAHDVRVPGRVGRRRHALDDLEDVGPSAHLLELADAPELVRQGQLVYGVATRVEARHGTVDDPVHLGVEVLRREPLGDNRDSRLGDQHGAYYSSLGLQVVRRHTSGSLTRGNFSHPPSPLHGPFNMQQKGLRYKTEPFTFWSRLCPYAPT